MVLVWKEIERGKSPDDGETARNEVREGGKRENRRGRRGAENRQRYVNKR